MEQRDLIKEEFERLGQALGRVLEWMLDRSSAPTLPSIQEKAQDALGLDLQALSVLEEEDFWQQLSAIYTLDAHWIEPLADLFFEVARLRETDGKTARGYWQKALWCYRWVHDQAAVYSMDRQFRMEQIAQKLL